LRDKSWLENFSVIDRKGTDCEKWDGLAGVFGRDDLLPMWVADMDLPAPPQVVDALKSRAEHPVYGYTLRPGSCYQAFIDWCRRRHSWPIDSDWLSSGPGVIPSMALCINIFTEPGDQVLIQTPVYHPFYHVVAANRRSLVTSPLVEEGGRYRMDYDDLARKFAQGVRMIILCNPHNPVGRVWTAEELTRLGELCLEYEVKIVADEIWCDLVYPPHRYQPMAAVSLEVANQTISLLAPSKTFNIAGIGSSVTVIPNTEWKARYDQALKRSYLDLANIFAITAFAAAYRHGEEWLDQLLSLLSSNCSLAVDALSESGVRVRSPEGTYLLWLDFRSFGVEHGRLAKALVEHGKIGLSDGRSFGSEGTGFMRMNVGCPRSLVEEGIARIRSTIAYLSGYSE